MEELNHLDKHKLPKHVGIILDGNRRWAKKNNVDINIGHLEGYKTLRERLFDFFDIGIKYLTIYALSLENAKKRTNQELDFIHTIIIKAIEVVKKEAIIKKEKIKINVLGRLNLLPDEVREKIIELSEFTKEHNQAYLNILIMYDGKAEIVDAVKEIISNKMDSKKVNENTIKEHLYTRDFPEVDFIIRTGMEDGARISGFLLWDASYAEFKFRKDLWPDYSKDMIIEDIKDFVQRNRRKGE